MQPVVIMLVVLAALVAGAIGGYLGVLLGPRRGTVLAGDRADAEPEFRLEHLDDQTWMLVNDGPGDGRLVSVFPLTNAGDQLEDQGQERVEVVGSEVLPTLAPGESLAFWCSRYDPRQRLAVSWTSPGNVRMGPVLLDLPGPARPR